MPSICAVLFDLDGVVRHFDPDNVARIERAHGLEPGSIEAIAFTPHQLEQATTGLVSRREWVERIGVELGNAAAAVAWGSQPFHVDNGTDTVPHRGCFNYPRFSLRGCLQLRRDRVDEARRAGVPARA